MPKGNRPPTSDGYSMKVLGGGHFRHYRPSPRDTALGLVGALGLTAVVIALSAAYEGAPTHLETGNPCLTGDTSKVPARPGSSESFLTGELAKAKVSILDQTEAGLVIGGKTLAQADLTRPPHYLAFETQGITLTEIITATLLGPGSFTFEHSCLPNPVKHTLKTGEAYALRARERLGY